MEPISTPKRADEAVHDLCRVLKVRSGRAPAPVTRSASSPSPVREAGDLLFPDVGKPSDIAQPGGFRRHKLLVAGSLVADARPQRGPLKESLVDSLERRASDMSEPLLKLHGEQRLNGEHRSKEWSIKQRWLFRYVMCVTMVNFSNQTVMTSFLPLELHTNRGFSLRTIGLLSATFPAAALLFTNLAVRITSAAPNIITLHSMSLVIMAVWTSGFGLTYLLPNHSALPGLFLMRFGQGGASALYFAATMCIMTRNFPSDIPKVVGYVETSMAVGSMLGRVVGGYLFALFGFIGPFIVEAIVLIILAVLGLFFNSNLTDELARPLLEVEASASGKRPGLHVRHQAHDQGILSTGGGYTVALATVGCTIAWLPCGFYDGCLAIHLDAFLGPLSPASLGPMLAITPLVYTFASVGVSAVIRPEILLRLMLFGACLCTIGMLLLGPAAPLQMVLPDHSSAGWVGEITALAVVAIGMSMLSIPALPLMQDAVVLGGPVVQESVSKYCIAGMSIGQGLGPVLGSAAMQSFGFAEASSIGASLFIAWFLLGAIYYATTPAPAAEDAAVSVFPSGSMQHAWSRLSSPYATPPGTPRMQHVDTVPMALEPTYSMYWTPAVQTAQRSRLPRSVSI